MIDCDHALPFARQTQLLDISRGLGYCLPRPIVLGEFDLTRRIDNLHLVFAFVCVRMRRRNLHRHWVNVRGRHLPTLMQPMGIEAVAPQSGISKPAPGRKVYQCLMRKLANERSTQVWALNTTYIPMACGFIFRTAMVDVASRRVLAHRAAVTLEACHAWEMIEQAFPRPPTPELVNTDQCS
jgi:putative transposase